MTDRHELHRLTRWPGIGPAAGLVLCLGCTTVWFCYEARALRHGRLIDLAPEWLGRPEIVQDNLVAIQFGAHIALYRAGGPHHHPSSAGISDPLDRRYHIYHLSVSPAHRAIPDGYLPMGIEYNLKTAACRVRHVPRGVFIGGID
jgi:hypothetical protein